jgi:hypothetical protein
MLVIPLGLELRLTPLDDLARDGQREQGVPAVGVNDADEVSRAAGVVFKTGVNPVECRRVKRISVSYGVSAL